MCGKRAGPLATAGVIGSPGNVTGPALGPSAGRPSSSFFPGPCPGFRNTYGSEVRWKRRPSSLARS